MTNEDDFVLAELLRAGNAPAQLNSPTNKRSPEGGRLYGRKRYGDILRVHVDDIKARPGWFRVIPEVDISLQEITVVPEPPQVTDYKIVLEESLPEGLLTPPLSKGGDLEPDDYTDLADVYNVQPEITEDAVVSELTEKKIHPANREDLIHLGALAALFETESQAVKVFLDDSTLEPVVKRGRAVYYDKEAAIAFMVENFQEG